MRSKNNQLGCLSFGPEARKIGAHPVQALGSHVQPLWSQKIPSVGLLSQRLSLRIIFEEPLQGLALQLSVQYPIGVSQHAPLHIQQPTQHLQLVSLMHHLFRLPHCLDPTPTPLSCSPPHIHTHPSLKREGGMRERSGPNVSDWCVRVSQLTSHFFRWEL
jgi:hypothetical protein